MLLRARTDHIKVLMARKGIKSMSHLAREMGISHASVSRQLNGLVEVSVPFIKGCMRLWPKEVYRLFELVNDELDKDDQPAAA